MLPYVLFFLVGLGIYIWLSVPSGSTKQGARSDPFRRYNLWDRIKPMRQPVMHVGGVRFSLHGRHFAAVGATGTGKSTSLAGLVDGRQPTLIIACDVSAPIEARVQKLAARGKALIWTMG